MLNKSARKDTGKKSSKTTALVDKSGRQLLIYKSTRVAAGGKEYRCWLPRIPGQLQVDKITRTASCGQG
jgi:hypothetical protein